MRKLATVAVLAVLVCGCSGRLPSWVTPQASRAMVEARIAEKLGDSQVTHHLLERQTIRWVDENFTSELDPSAPFAGTGEYHPDNVIWVSYLEGTLSPSLWPSPAHPARGFSKVLTIYSLGGDLMAARALPLPPD